MCFLSHNDIELYKLNISIVDYLTCIVKILVLVWNIALTYVPGFLDVTPTENSNMVLELASVGPFYIGGG